MMEKKLSRREFLLLGGQGVAAAAFLASCGQQATPAPAAPAAPEATKRPRRRPTDRAPAKAPTRIEFLAWGDTTDGPAWEKLGPAYMAKNPAQVVNITPVADPNANFYTKLQTMFAGGTPPDLASFQGWEWQVYADKNLLAPIDDYHHTRQGDCAVSAGLHQRRAEHQARGQDLSRPAAGRHDGHVLRQEALR